MKKTRQKKRSWSAADVAWQAKAAAEEKKAENSVAMDMRAVSSVADVFFICSAASEKQVEAVVRNIEERLTRSGLSPLRLEGLPEARWVVMDYGDTLIHVFREDVRKYFSIETLWGDASKIFSPE